MIFADPCTIQFQALREEHLSIVLPWFKESHVAQWWPTPEPDELLEKFLERIRSKDTFGYIVSIDKKHIGYIQYYYLSAVEPKAGVRIPIELPSTTVGTDQFIGDPAYIGKGYGAHMIKAFIEFLQNIEPTITTVIVDPEPTNYAAIRCYEKVGFKKIIEYATPYGPTLLMRYDI